MSAFRIFSRVAELLDIKVTRAAAAWLRLNPDGTVSQRTAAETISDLNLVLPTTWADGADSATRNNNTFAADAVLTGMAYEANTNYILQFSITMIASGSSGYKWRLFFSSRSSHTEYHCGLCATPSTAPLMLYLTPGTGYTDPLARSSSTTGFTYSGQIMFKSGASAGSLSLEWAQSSTDAAQTAKRGKDSWLRLTKV